MVVQNPSCVGAAIMGLFYLLNIPICNVLFYTLSICGFRDILNNTSVPIFEYNVLSM